MLPADARLPALADPLRYRAGALIALHNPRAFRGTETRLICPGNDVWNAPP